MYHDTVIEPTHKTVRRWLNKIGEEQFVRLLNIRTADIQAHAKGTQASRIERCATLGVILDEIIQDNQCFKMKDLQICGHDVMSLLDIPEGKEVGVVLNKVLEKVITGELPNDRVALVRYLTILAMEGGT